MTCYKDKLIFFSIALIFRLFCLNTFADNVANLIKESSDECIIMYPLKINKNSFIKSKDPNKKMRMFDRNIKFQVFKYKSKIYVTGMTCPCCDLFCRQVFDKSIQEHDFCNCDDKQNCNNINFECKCLFVPKFTIKYINSLKNCRSCSDNIFRYIDKNSRNCNCDFVKVNDVNLDNLVTFDDCENVNINVIPTEIHNIVGELSSKEVEKLMKERAQKEKR